MLEEGCSQDGRCLLQVLPVPSRVLLGSRTNEQTCTSQVRAIGVTCCRGCESYQLLGLTCAALRELRLCLRISNACVQVIQYRTAHC